MQGRRVYLVGGDNHLILAEGDYGFDKDGLFWCRPPGGFAGVLEPDRWTITEHEDGTVTIDPSIHEPGRYHGWLKAGVWSDA